MEYESGRRGFIKTATLAGAGLALASSGISSVFGQTAQTGAPATPAAKAIAMAKLPYAEGALEPIISSRTVNVHYTMHHRSYFDLLTAYIGAHPEHQNLTLEELIGKNKDGILLDETIFDVSVLLYNHNWYWPSMKPKGGGKPTGDMEKKLVARYGSYEAFRKVFVEEGMKLGSGWVWVVQDGDKAQVYRSEYHDTPLVKGYRPLLAIDVWEHAYYLDYTSDRQKYLEAVLDNLINWEFAEKNLAKKSAVNTNVKKKSETKQ